MVLFVDRQTDFQLWRKAIFSKDFFMKTISRVLASLVLMTTAGVASAQAAAKDFYVEGAYAFTAVKDSVRVNNTNVDLGVSGYGLYLKPKYEVVPGTEVFARIGYTSSKFTASAGNVSVTSATLDSVSYGVGTQTDINKDWYAQVDYMLFSKKDGTTTKGLGVSAGYRF